MNRVVRLSLAIIASALLFVTLLLGSDDTNVHAQQGDVPTPTPANVPGPVFDIQGLPLEGKVSPPRYLNLDSNLNRVVEQARTGQLTTRAAAASAPKYHGQSVAVTLYIIEGYADAIASYLEANGASPRNIDADYIEAYIPVSLLAEASEREGVLSARTIIPPHPDQGSVVSGGVAAHGVPSWHAAGYKGRDVKIGVIDLSFKGFAGLMGSELPATVQARCYASVGNFTTNLSDCISTSSPERSRRHGTAVTEALFDIAPQADYYISDAGSYRDLLNTVNWMVSQGVDVINMSLAWGFDGPGDGTSYYSNAPLKSVDAAVTGGIIWVNGAGNSARDSWYGAFEDSDADGVHEFNASGNECNRVTIDLDPLEGFTAQLRWADSWGGASKDLNLYLISDPGSTFSLSDAVATSENNQVGAGNDIPYEWISIDHGDIANGEYCLAVNQTSGAAPSWIQLLLWGASDDLQNYVSAHSIGNPAESRNAGMLSAGAAPFSNTSTIESFSSRGPTTDNRTKPDIVGADGGTSSTRGTWKGTSQASPHVAGLAALVKQVYPSRSPSSIASYLKDNALGRDTVPNNTWGYGFARLPPPPDTTLSALTLSDIDFGTLTSDTTSYFASVANSVTQTMITPTLNDSEASYVIKIGGVTDEDGTVSLAEGINVITVEVTADDDETKKSYTVTVSRIGTLALTYKENGTASLHTLSANGLEQSTTTWSLEGTDYYYFTIGSTGILSFASSPDYESPADSGGDNVYEVTVSAKDAVLNSTAVEVTVTVEDVDEPPLITGVSTIDDYDENGSGDVATYTAIDPEGDSNVTWSLAGPDRGDFDITGGVLTFRNVPDYEHAADSGGNNHYEVTVQATDANNKRGELHIDVIVKNVDEPPVITGPDTVDDYPENSAASRQVGRYTASDPEGATVTLSLTGTDSDDFTFASNVVLTFKESPDYEEQRSYRVTVRAEAGSHTIDRVVTINIQDVEEPGTVTFSKVQPQEGTQLTATLDDDDGPTGTTWQWYRTSSRGSASTAITGADSQSYTPDATDVGRYLRVVASYDDGHGTGKSVSAVSANRVQEAPPVPEPPVFPTDGNYDRSISESLRAGSNVGAPVTASDGNNDRLTYSIAASDEFEIVESTGQLRTKVELDHEGREQYSVTVTATDPSGLTDTVSVTITVEDLNETPVVSGESSLELEEGTGTGITLAAYTSTDPDREGIDLNLSGTDSEDFILGGGGLTFNEVPNFEEPADSNRDNRYQITVEAREQGDGTSVGRLNVTISVTNVDEPGVLEVNVEEPRVGQTMRLKVEDEDGGVSVREWEWERGDPNGSCTAVTTWESINSARSSSYTPTAADQGHCIRATAFYNDRAGTGRIEQFLTPSSVETGPFFTQEPPDYRVQEATAEGRSIGRVQAQHSNRGEVLTYRLSGDDARYFTIDSNAQLKTSATPLDYETRSDKDAVVVITAGDESGQTATITAMISVIEVNEGPEISLVGSTPGSVPENYDPSLVLARYTATDPEGGTVSRWRTSGTDGGDFAINEQGELRFRYTPDYERPADSNRDNIYVFTVQVSDGRHYGTFDETVAVTPVDEPPTITTTSSSARALRQNENQTSRLYTYSATDPEGGTVTWSVGGVDGRFFAIDERGQFSFSESSPPDFEQPGDSGKDNVYDVTIQAWDDGFNTASLPVTVTVREVNEGPEVTGGRFSFTINENQDLPNAIYAATDPEGGSVTRWSLGGSDGGDFTISEAGVLTFRHLPDYERPADSNRDNVYELQVRPYDGRYYGSFDVTVTVNDVNEPPTITTTSASATTLRQKENLTNRLYTYRATDPEGSTVTWSVGGTDGRYFAIDERGQFSFREEDPPDFDQPGDSGRDNVYEVTIQARDDGSNTRALSVTVTVTNDAEGVEPTISTRNPPSSYRENGTSAVYTFRASDPQRQSITWSLEGEDRGDFTLTEDSSGRGVLAFSVPPDFEDPSDSDRQNDYELTVIATDEDGHSDRLSFTITVTAVDEGPEVSGPSTFTIAENRGLSNAVYTATDPEGANVARWSVGGRDGGDFSITQGGTLYFRNLPDYERPADSNRDNVYEVTIQPSDGRNTGSYPVTVTVTDVNEPPEIRRGSTTSFTQQENRTSRLYTYSATDPEEGAVTWSVGGTDGNNFTIDERGQFSFREENPPDFDTPADDDEDNVYNATIQARDPESNTASLSVTVTVTEVNEGPVITRQGSAPGSVPENHGADQVLATYTAADPERPSVRITGWSTAGTDGGDFVINALGELRFRNTPDYERPADSNRDNVYEVTIRASDGRNTGTLEEVQVVTVTDVNEPPTIITTSRTAFTQQENRTSVLYTFRATDPEGATVTWSAGGTDGRYFAIDEQGRFSFREDSPPDFDSPGDADRNNVYNVTVQARDPESNTSSLDVVVTVTDHNENVEPTISTRRPPTTYRENGTAAVYTFRASDPQSGTTITWSLTGTDAGDFTVTADSSGRGVLTFASSPDFESPADADRDNTYELAVVATDDEGNTDRVDFTITVTNHNEGVEPTISTRRPPTTYRENGTSTIYTFRASDPQSGTTISWSLTGTDAGDFTITVDTSGRGVLTFNSVPDFESPADSDQDNAYELAVVAADGDGNSDRVAFAITVTDVNEPPVVTLNGTATTTVPENTADTQVLARFAARDPENPSAGIYRWSTSGRDGGDFVISELGELRFRASPDYERPADSDRDNVYEVTVRASDGSSYGMPENTLTITISQMNEPPVITTKSRTEFSLRENSTSTIYTYRATDQDDSDLISWSVEGADGGDFAIHTGVLTFRLLPDLENPVDADEDNVYEITVVASDQAGLRDTVNAVITITDQSEGPVIAGRTSYTVAENYDITQALGTFTATDAKDGRTVYPQWLLSGRDGGDFVIDRSSGALTFRDTPDYDRPADSDRDNVYEVTVRGHDSQAYGDLNITITVTNINEAAPVVSGRNTHTVRENTASAFYTYRAADSDLDDTVAWSVEGTDGEDFAIDGNGALSFGSTPDYETPVDSDSNNVYALTVVATDGGGLRGTFAVVASVTELNEGPAVTGTASFTVNENNDLTNATYSASDPEATGGVTTTITWSVSGRDGGDFTIDRETGVLTFRTLPDHERPADGNRDNEYEVTVRAYDGRNYGTFDVTVTVLDVSEIAGPTSLDRSENFTGVLATYAAAGQGALDATPAWRLTGTDGGDFSIDEQGQLTFRYSPDYERPADSNRDNVYDFVVQVSDGSYYETFDVTITVTPVNEPPAITGRDSLSFRENTPVTTSLYTYRAIDSEGDDFAWHLDGLDAGDFSITTDNSGRGVLTFASPPNFDSPTGSGTDGNEYLVTVQARDDQGNTGEFPVTITVTDQNEGATVSGRTEIAVEENRDATLVLATYTASDPEGQAITRWSLGGSDSGDFSISEDGELTFRNTPDYDRPADSNLDNEYLVAVRAYDGSAYGNLDVTVTVSNVNEHDPVIRSGSRTSFSYWEEGTSTVYSYSATDQDKDDTITWTTAGSDGALFEFDDRNALSFREPPDYEDPRDAGRDNEYELGVVAMDSGGRSHRLDVTVAVTEVDEGPEITGTTAYTVAEGQELSGAIFSATDPEDPSIEVTNWRTSGIDGGDFTMSEDGELSFRSTTDYERPADSNRDNVYIFTVQVSDGHNFGSLDVTVTVTDLNESNPEVSGRDTLSVRENTTSTLYTFSARDMDRGAEIMWSVRGTDSDDFSISDEGELSFSSNPDHEQPADADSDNVYELTVVASDGQNEGTLDVTVTVNEVNEGPEISGRDTLNVSENHDEVLATYSGTDPEDTSAEITSWSVTGRDGGDFTINDLGKLTFRSPPDYERPADSDRDNEYEVTVRASDGQVYGTYDVTVTVEAVDEAPEFQSGSRNSFSYRENGTSVLYTYRATDPEGADVSWSVSGTDGGDFAITTDSSSRGVLSFEEPPDYDDPADDDDDSEYEVTVVATDQTGHAASLAVTVTVTDVNEGPTVSGTAEYTVRENHEAALGTYTARDPEDPSLEITRWSVTGRDGGDFAINEDGELSFRSPPDYERPADGNRDNVYEVTVRASDGSYYGNFEVTVTVEAVNEPPDITGDEAISYQENGDRALETYRATDPEKADITWGLSGTDAGAFAISETGVLTFRNLPDYEDPEDSDDDNVYEVTVEATDEDGETGRLEVQVTVTNVTD